MSFATNILPEELRSIDSSGFDDTYQPLDTRLGHMACLVKFVNASDIDVTISWDGVTDHDFIPANSFALYDITQQTQREFGIYISKGTQFYVKGAEAGEGSVYMTVLYPAEG